MVYLTLISESALVQADGRPLEYRNIVSEGVSARFIFRLFGVFLPFLDMFCSTTTFNHHLEYNGYQVAAP